MQINHLVKQIKQIYIVWLIPEVFPQDPRDMISEYNPIICCNQTNLKHTYYPS